MRFWIWFWIWPVSTDFLSNRSDKPLPDYTGLTGRSVYLTCPRYLSCRGDGEEAEMGIGIGLVRGWAAGAYVSPHAAGRVWSGRPRRRRLYTSAGRKWEKNGSASGFEGEMARQRLSYLLVALDWNTWLSLAARPAGQPIISCPKSTLGVLAGCHGSRQELGYPWSRSLLPVREAMCCFIPFDPFYIMGRCINFTWCLRGDMLWAVLGQVCLFERQGSEIF